VTSDIMDKFMEIFRSDARSCFFGFSVYEMVGAKMYLLRSELSVTSNPGNFSYTSQWHIRHLQNVSGRACDYAHGIRRTSDCIVSGIVLCLTRLGLVVLSHCPSFCLLAHSHDSEHTL
jgi:hypothetical protein